LRCSWTIIERAGLSILTHLADVSAELISLSKPHECWCSHEHADIYTDMKSKCGHICEAVVFSVNARAGIFMLLRRQPDGDMQSRRVMPTSVSVIGMGKLGAPMAAAMAARGIRAIGVDSDAAKVEAIERGMPPVFEPRLAETLNLAQGRLTSTQSIEDSVRDSDITFIVCAKRSAARLPPNGSITLWRSRAR